MKLVKNILRSTMPDDRLSVLAVISIATKISGLYDALIIQFEENKDREKRFAKYAYGIHDTQAYTVGL